MESTSFIPYAGPRFEEPEMLERVDQYLQYMDQRRSVREYSDKPVPRALVEKLILTAGTAPSGAHKQPWTFCLVSNPEIKKAIRIAAEEEEYENYHGRMSDSWLKDLAPLATDWHKPFLEIAPWLIVVFKKPYDLIDGERHKNYYVNESVGLAAGFLISAIHQAGLVTLTHTPSPMNFLQNILKRPENERAFLLLPVGYPKEGTEVPDLLRKPLEELMVSYV